MARKNVICLAIVATIFNLNVNNYKVVNAEQINIGEFDSLAWKNWENNPLTPDSVGNITCGNGRLFCSTKYPVTFDESEKTMTVSIDFSFIKKNDNYVKYQWMPLISYSPITQDTDYNGKIGTVDNILGLRCLYADATAWTNKNYRMSAASGDGSWKNDYYTTLDPMDGAKHNLTFVLDENGVFSKFDGNVMIAKGTTDPYYFRKSDSSKYTIKDFIIDDEPSVYFAIDTAQNYATTIYKPVKIEHYNFEYTTFDDLSWANWNNVALKPTVGGNIYTSNGRLFSKSKMPFNFNEETNTITVDIDWSFIKQNDNYLTYQWMPLISYSPITQDSDYKGKLSTVDEMLGFKCFYKDVSAWESGNFRFGACAGNGGWKNDYYTTINPTNNAIHRLTFVLDPVGVYAKIDNKVIVKSGTSAPYYFQKSNGDNYTIKDFIVDGQPSIYFAIDTAQNYATTIYKPESKTIAFNSTKWFKYTGDNYFNPTNNESIDTANGIYYKDKLKVEEYNAQTKIMKVSVSFSINVPNFTSNQFVPFFTSETIEENWTTAQSRIGGTFSTPTVAARLYYQTEDKYNKNSLLARVCDYKNYETADYVDVNPTDEAHHTISLIMTSAYVYMEFDGITLSSNGKQYKLSKDETGTNLYTIDDFLKDGEPSIYFGVFRSSDNEHMKIYNSKVDNQDMVNELQNSMKTTSESVRLSDPKGLKFTSSVSPSYYNYLVQQIGEDNIELGTLMLPKTKLGENELKVDSTEVLKGIRTKWVDHDKRIFAVSLVDIPNTKYDEIIVARTFMSFTLSGVTYTIYGNTIEKSIKEVAIDALSDYDKETTATSEADPIRNNEHGFNFLVTIDGTNYVYSKFSQVYIDILRSFAI